MPHTVTIRPGGGIEFIHNDAIARVLRPIASEVTIRRASHVEPTSDGRWAADLSPVGGPSLGPFEDRADALAAEVRWLKTNLNL